MNKLVILNNFLFTDKQLAELRKYCELDIYDDTDSEEKVSQRIQEADIVLANPFVAPLTRKSLNFSTNLKLIVLNSAGYNNLDIEFLTERGIKVANNPTYATDAVAEHTFALMFAANREIIGGNSLMKDNPTEIIFTSPERDNYLGFTLKGKNLGIIGLGKIGNRVAEIGEAFGMNLLIHTRTNSARYKNPSLKEVIKNSDIITLHLPLNPETEKILSDKEFELMKKDVILVNTSRGGLIDESALYKFLMGNKQASAALDVLENYSKENRLLNLNNIILTPHIAYLTKESLKLLTEGMISNVINYLEGTPSNIVN